MIGGLIPEVAALLASAHMAARERPRARSVLAGLAGFAARRGISPAPGCLLDWDVIEAFCVAGLAGRASSTRGTYRSVLYQLAAPVHGKPDCRATPFAGARAPYSPAKRAGLAAIARAQRGPAKRASALAMVVFGIGAGLRPGELAGLRGSHVTRRGGQVVVEVTGAPAPRTAARGHKTGWPGYDRAYTDALPGRFHLPARALGYQPVTDYKTGQPGIQGSAGGAILTEGSWYCPAMPEPLVTATTDLRNHAIDRDLYQARIAARAPYRLKRKDGPDADGYERLTCPALGSHPALACPLRPGSLSPRDGRPKILAPPEEPPRICQQAAITIPPDAGARYRQGLPYGSEAWHARYATLRNTIEGLNGFVKDPAHEALAQPGRRRVRGIAAQPVFTALLLAAANIRKIRAWRELTPADKTRIACRARRRRTSLSDYLPDG